MAKMANGKKLIYAQDVYGVIKKKRRYKGTHCAKHNEVKMHITLNVHNPHQPSIIYDV